MGPVGRKSRITLEELMLRTMLKSKVHRATVTQADLHYVGSVTIDADLMEAADLLPGEQVAIVDIDNGARLGSHRDQRGGGPPCSPGRPCHPHLLHAGGRRGGAYASAEGGARRHGEP